MSLPSRWRVLTAFAILPVLQAGAAFAAFPLVWQLGDHGAGRLTDEGQAARAFAMVTGVMGLLVTITGAIPIVFWLMRRGRASFPRLLLAGLALGNVPFAVYVVALILPATIGHLAMGTISEHLMPVSELLAGSFRAILIGSVLGTWSAAIFWVLAFAGTDLTVQQNGFVKLN